MSSKKFTAFELGTDGKPIEEVCPKGTTSPVTLHRLIRKASGDTGENGHLKPMSSVDADKNIEVISACGTLEINGKKYEVRTVGDNSDFGNMGNEFGGLMEAALEEISECPVCRGHIVPDANLWMSEDGLEGFVHDECKDLFGKAIERGKAEDHENKRERFRQRRYKELQVLMHDAELEARADRLEWVDPEPPESFPEGAERCFLCSGHVTIGNNNVVPRDVLRGQIQDTGEACYAHIECLRNEVLKDPELRILMFFESYGLRLHEEVIKSCVKLQAAIKYGLIRRLREEYGGNTVVRRDAVAPEQLITESARSLRAGDFLGLAHTGQEVPVAAMSHITDEITLAARHASDMLRERLNLQPAPVAGIRPVRDGVNMITHEGEMYAPIIIGNDEDGVIETNADETIPVSGGTSNENEVVKTIMLDEGSVAKDMYAPISFASEETQCVACGGTEVASSGEPCVPCQQKKDSK